MAMQNITIDDLKQEPGGVTDEQLKQRCTEEHLKEIAPSVKNYTSFAHEFNIPAGIQSDIRTDQNLDYIQKTEAVFLWWHANIKNPTYLSFVEVCLKLFKGNIAREMCKLCATQSKDHPPLAPVPSPASLETFNRMSWKKGDISSPSIHGTETFNRMSWKKGDISSPEKLLRPIDAVVNGDTAYFRNFRTPTVYSYNRLKQKWEQLPGCRADDTSLAVLPVTYEGAVQYCLHTVGGKNPLPSVEEFSGAIYQYVRVDKVTPWQPANYPDMKFKRSQVTVVYSNDHVIAAGGCGDHGVVNTIEVLNTSHLHTMWFEVAFLPLAVFRASQCVCDGILYILGGDVLDPIGSYSATKCACKTSIKDLVTSRPGDNVFTSIDDLRFKESSFVSFHNHVVQIGGWRFHRGANQPLGTDHVHVYNKEIDLWVELSKCLNESWCLGFAIAFGDEMIMTVGGYNKPNGLSTDSVEFGTIV